MNPNRKSLFFLSFALLSIWLFSSSCSNLPLIGKKEKKDPLPEGTVVTVEGMETVRGVHPPKTEPPPSTKPSPRPTDPKREDEIKVTSIPARPFPSPALPFFQPGFKRKVAILDFENKTAYREEKIGEAVARKLFDKLETTRRVVTVDKTVVTEMLNREDFKFEALTEPSVMKQVHQSLGIQAFAYGAITDLSLLPSKASDAPEEETAFATIKIEIRLVDASTGNLLKSFIGRTPIFGVKETGENSRAKAVQKAIDLGLDDILEGFLRQLDLLEWTTTVAKIEGESLFINAGRLSGLRVGDTLEVFEPGKEIIHPATKFSLGWTTGQSRGVIAITDLFGVDAAIGKVVQGKGFHPNDVVKSMIK